VRIRISERGAKFDVGVGLALLSSIGAMILPLFIVIDALLGRLTWLLPLLISACAIGAALGGALTSRPFTAAAGFAAGLFVGAVVLICNFVVVIADAGAVNAKSVAFRVVAISLAGGVLLLVMSLLLRRSARRCGEVV